MSGKQMHSGASVIRSAEGDGQWETRPLWKFRCVCCYGATRRALEKAPGHSRGRSNWLINLRLTIIFKSKTPFRWSSDCRSSHLPNIQREDSRRPQKRKNQNNNNTKKVLKRQSILTVKPILFFRAVLHKFLVEFFFQEILCQQTLSTFNCVV